MIWTISGADEVCGYAFCGIPAGSPIALVGPVSWPRARLKKRCAFHACAEVNWTEIDQARAALELERANHEATMTPAQYAAQATASRKPKRRDAFDPKLAAAGKDA